MLMENILPGGIYRTVEVRISGAGHKPPAPNEMYQQIKDFYSDMPCRAQNNAVELAAWTHAEFVKIHPYVERKRSIGQMIIKSKYQAKLKTKGLDIFLFQIFLPI